MNWKRLGKATALAVFFIVVVQTGLRWIADDMEYLRLQADGVDLFAKFGVEPPPRTVPASGDVYEGDEDVSRAPYVDWQERNGGYVFLESRDGLLWVAEYVYGRGIRNCSVAFPDGLKPGSVACQPWQPWEQE